MKAVELEMLYSVGNKKSLFSRFFYCGTSLNITLMGLLDGKSATSADFPVFGVKMVSASV